MKLSDVPQGELAAAREALQAARAESARRLGAVQALQQQLAALLQQQQQQQQASLGLNCGYFMVWGSLPPGKVRQPCNLAGYASMLLHLLLQKKTYITFLRALRGRKRRTPLSAAGRARRFRGGAKRRRRVLAKPLQRWPAMSSWLRTCGGGCASCIVCQAFEPCCQSQQF